MEGMRVLITGFEPFDGRTRNASADFADFARAEAASWRARGFLIQTALLPVSYARIEEALELAIGAGAWDALVCVGEAKTPWLRLETTARNEDNSQAVDNDGVCRSRTPIRAGAPAELPSGLDLDSMRWRLELAGLPVKTSDDAGGFLCNRVFYLAAVRAEARRAGFVHVPAGMEARWRAPLLDAILKSL
jgi:pyroglutamyl-peptidase